ncbi:3-oxo-tetronate kinase [Ornithinimicrobium sp. LYQ92]|uniref:3-oxo-tetronate kinase n=1 Tax=Serinicoccus sp. LYQ92 TaxID=3378798 RepID=UPI0038525F0E
MRHAAIADDFTGATDLAGNWRARGLRTSVLLGAEHDPAELAGLKDDDAVVVALKTRSIAADAAVEQSLTAARLLRGLGYEQLYDKYCSTFDSTPQGNIGPVADALLELTGASRAVVVPSFPDNHRTVYQGHLFVGSQPLDESPLKDHPLNPMWDSDVVRILSPQTVHQVGLVPHEVVRQGPAAVREVLDRAEADGRRLVVVDALTNDDLAVIAEATRQDPLVTGGSGLALGALAGVGQPEEVTETGSEKLILSGSASAATQEQVQRAQAYLAHRRLDVAALAGDRDAELDRVVSWVCEEWRRAPGSPVLVYSVGHPGDVDPDPAVRAATAPLVEAALADVAALLSGAGALQLVVAGGETSGAVLERLGVRRLRVGQPLSPGVSWLSGTDAGGTDHNVVLKSGNFGTADLFLTAWEALR